MTKCRLELLGLYEPDDYTWYARAFLSRPTVKLFVSGVNICDHQRGSQPLDLARSLLSEVPDLDICMHYSLVNHLEYLECGSLAPDQRPIEDFEDFCKEAHRLGVSRVLLVSGPGHWQQFDTVALLERLESRVTKGAKSLPRISGTTDGDAPNQSWKRSRYGDPRIEDSGRVGPGKPLGVRLGVAFNASLTCPRARGQEQQRLEQKLKTGLVDDVWLNTGVETALLRRGIELVHEFMRRGHDGAASFQECDMKIFASVLRPNEGQRWQFRWGRNGVDFGPRFLDSLEGMEACTKEALEVFRALDVQPLVESKVFTEADLQQLVKLLALDATPSDA